MIRTIVTGTLASLMVWLSAVDTGSAALVQYWPLDDGVANAADLTADNTAAGGNPGALMNFGLNGTPNDTPGDWITSGLPPTLAHSTGALDFDGVANYVDGGNIGLSAGTVSMWINQRSATGDDRLFSQHSGPVAQGGAVRIGNATADGRMQVWTGSTWSDLAPAGTINTGSWQHVALVYSGGSATAYVDGAQQATAATDFGFAAANFGIADKFLNLHGSAFSGAIDDLAIWDNALPAAQITELAGGESPANIGVVPPPTSPRAMLRHYWPLDDGVGATANNVVSAGNNGSLVSFDGAKINDGGSDTPPGDWVSGPLSPRLAHSSGALDFDKATNGFVDGGDIGIRSTAPGEGASVSLWYKANTMPQAGEDGHRLFSATGDVACCNPGNPGGVARVTENGAVEIWPGHTAWMPVTADGAITEGEWHHIALVWNADQVTGYVDGVEGLTAASTFDFDASTDPSVVGFGLGQRYHAFNGFFGQTPDGVFDDVSIWHGALSGDEIAFLAAGVSPLQIPEPSSIVLLLLGGVGLLGRRRIKRR